MLGKLFDADNVAWRTVSRFGDICFLNFLFIITAWPIITIGPALTALYTVSLKMVKEEENGIIKTYFKAFKDNFRQAFILGIMCLALIAIISFDIYYISLGNNNFTKVIVYLIGGIAVFIFFIIEYIFPILARFDNTIKNTIRNAILMVIANFPKTLIISASTLAFAYFTTFDADIYVYGVTFWFLCGFALLTFCNSFFFRDIFLKYEINGGKISSEDESLENNTIEEYDSES